MAYKTADAARLIGVSKQTLLRWLHSKQVEDVKRDRNSWREFTDSDVARIKVWAGKSEVNQ